MNNRILRAVVFVVVSLFALQHANADDHAPPFMSGDYWEVTGIKLADGAGLKYEKWLASEWRKSMEYAVSEGWLKGYKVIRNVHARADEADLYIITMFENMPSVAEDEKRREKYLSWAKKSMEKMESESGDRSEYRTIMSTALMREMNFRN